MSATGRSDVRDPSDTYYTPTWCTRRLLEAVDLPGGMWLEPSAGEGAIIRAVNALRSDVTWTAVELRQECMRPLHALNLNSLQFDSFTALRMRLRYDRFDVVIGNPPYSSALAFVQRALDLAPVVVFLLRLNWLASQERVAWMRDHVPDVFVLPNRPSFTGVGGDATEYAWMRFVQAPRTSGLLQVLRDTPAAERCGQAAVPTRSAQLELPEVA